MNVAVVFPGQGAQRLGMGADLAARFPVAARVFEEAADALGFDMLALCREGPEESLALTENTQPAILTVSVAAYRAWRETAGVAPVCAAGHSLGEYSALVAAGALEFAAAVKTVRARGRAMQAAVPVGAGAMAAVLGLDAAALEAVCAAASDAGGVVAPANFNAPGQIVISGAAEAVARAGELAKARGAKRILPLDVSAPFHCPLMEPAAKALEQELAGVAFRAPAFAVVANVDAQFYAGGAEDARRRLTAQVCAPVRWDACVKRLAQAGATAAVEFGPGKVVTALIKRIEPSLALFNVETAADLERFSTEIA